MSDNAEVVDGAASVYGDEDRFEYVPQLSGWALVAAGLAAGAAAAHLPVMPEHFRSAPYMGGLFGAFALVILALGAAILVLDSRWAYLALGSVCTLAVLTYGATRTFAFPDLADDVGNWWEPLGVLSVVLELGTAAACAAALISRQRTPLAESPSTERISP